MAAEELYTQAQRDALEAAYRLLGEHFESSLIVVCAEVMTGGASCDLTRVYWAGGHPAAVGLARLAEARMKEKPTQSEEP